MAKIKRTTEAQAEIAEFLNSGAPGIISSFTKPVLWRAAESLFTAKGQDCPVEIKSIDQQTTLLINKEVYYKNRESNTGNLNGS